MRATITRVAGSTIYAEAAEYPGSELVATALSQRTGPGTFTSFDEGDVVQLIEDDDGGWLAIGVIR